MSSCKESTTREIFNLEEKILAKLKKNEDVVQDIICLLKKIKKLIKIDIEIDARILQIVQSILNIVQNINVNIDILISLACTPISSVPFVITKPGCYKVINELAFTGPGNAITILTNDVIIDGGNFTLTITGPTTVGVFSNGFENIVIRNFNIKSSDPSPGANTANRAITLAGGNNFYLERIHTYFTNRGLNISNSFDITIKNCVIDRHTGGVVSAGILLLGSISNALIKGCQFYKNNRSEDAGRGISSQPSAGGTNVNNIKIEDCQFSDSLVFVASFLSTLGVNNLEVTNCQFSVTDPEYQGWSFLAVSEAGNLVVRGVTLKGCEFTNNEASLFFEPVLLVGVDGFLIEDCNITSNSVGNFIDRGIINVALIHLGYTISGTIDAEDIPDAQVENGTVKDCNLSGGNSLQANHQNVGIYIESAGKNVTIDHVNIEQTGTGNLAPPIDLAFAPKKVKVLYQSTFEGEVEFKREKKEKAVKVNKKLEAIMKKLPALNKLKVPPPIPDQRAAAILVDGGTDIIVKNCSITESGSGSTGPGSLPGSGVVFSGFLQFQSIPGFVDPPLTIDVPPTSNSKVIECDISSSSGDGVQDFGIANYVNENSSNNNLGNGFTLAGSVSYITDNDAFDNVTNGYENTGFNNSIADNRSSNNIGLNYVGVPAMVPQDAPAVAGQNLTF